MRRRGFLRGLLAGAALSFLTPGLAQAALAIVTEETSHAAHDAGDPNTSPVTLSWTFPNAAGGTLVVCGFVSSSDPQVSYSAPSWSTPTYGGSNMTQIGIHDFEYNNGPGAILAARVGLYEIVNPATGSQTVSITVTNTNLYDVLGGCISFSGANASSPAGNFQSSDTGITTQTSFSQSVPSTLNGDWVVGVACTGTSFGAATSPTIMSALDNKTANTTCDNIILTQQSTGGGTVTVSGATAAVADVDAVGAAEIFAAAGAGMPPLRTLMGVGQ